MAVATAKPSKRTKKPRINPGGTYGLGRALVGSSAFFGVLTGV
jgi:hypothetical protein